MHPNFVCSKENDSATYVGLKRKKHEAGAHLPGAGGITKLDASSRQRVGRERLGNKEEENKKRNVM